MILFPYENWANDKKNNTFAKECFPGRFDCYCCYCIVCTSSLKGIQGLTGPTITRPMHTITQTNTLHTTNKHTQINIIHIMEINWSLNFPFSSVIGSNNSPLHLLLQPCILLLSSHWWKIGGSLMGEFIIFCVIA